MTCKDCIHSEVCYYHGEDIDSPGICGFFKDRSRFVELPCKAGTTVYTVSLKHGVVPWGVYAICSTVTKWDAAPKITLLARSAKLGRSANFSAKTLSASVFLTREEAEQALKEREENETDN